MEVKYRLVSPAPRREGYRENTGEKKPIAGQTIEKSKSKEAF